MIDFHAATFLLILGCMTLLFFRPSVPIELTALAGLLALVLAGFITPDQAFQGFSSPVTITMISMFALGAALATTGVTDGLAAVVYRVVKRNEAGNVALVMLLGVGFSTFMNNVAAAALLLPVVGSISHKTSISQSRLLMPLSFAVVLGGMCTLIGTPPNLLAHEALRQAGYAGFKLFDFLPFGLLASFVGILYMAIWGYKQLPVGEERLTAPTEADLPRLYGIEDNLSTLRLSKRAAASSARLHDLGFGHDLGLVVVLIERQGRQILAPSAQERIYAGDHLIVSGKPEERAKLEKFGELVPTRGRNHNVLSSDSIAVFEAVLSPRSQLLGKTLEEVAFRERYGCQVLAILRKAAPIRSGIASIPLEFGDGLLMQGPRSRLAMLQHDPDFLVLTDVRTGTSRLRKAPFVILALLTFFLLVALHLQPVHVAAFIAALVVLVSGALSTEDFYRGMSWRIVFFVAAILPLSVAAKNSGFSDWLTHFLVQVVEAPSPMLVMAAFCVVGSLIGQLIEPSLAIILLAPVAIEMSKRLGLHPEPLVMGLCLGSSIGFQIHFSNRANLLVMAAGGYRFGNFFRVGTPLTILVVAVLLVALSIWYGVPWK